MKHVLHPLAAVAVLVSLSGCMTLDSELANVPFRLVSTRGEPLAQRRVVIFGTVYDRPHFPYDERLCRELSYYHSTVYTDQDGRFTLNMADLPVADIVLQPGPPQEVITLGRASGVGETPSPDIIRVVRTDAGSAGVRESHVYDLRRGVVRIIPVSGDRVVEKEFREVILVAPPIPTAGDTN